MERGDCIGFVPLSSDHWHFVSIGIKFCNHNCSREIQRQAASGSRLAPPPLCRMPGTFLGAHVFTADTEEGIDKRPAGAGYGVLPL